MKMFNLVFDTIALILFVYFSACMMSMGVNGTGLKRDYIFFALLCGLVIVF